MIVAIVFVCLVVATLMNAASIKRTAEQQPFGWQRSVAMAFAGPTYAVSHFLHFDRPREWIDSALGREPAGSTTAAVTTTTAPEPAADPPVAKTDLYANGDSMAFEIVPFYLRVTGQPDLPYEDENHLSAGLTRLEKFDYLNELPGLMEEYEPRVMLFTLGSNDNTDIRIDGERLVIFTPEWNDEYAKRTGAVMDMMTGPFERPLIWIGLPITDNPERDDWHQKLNEIYAAEADKRDSVEFIDIWEDFTDDDGNYATYLPNKNGDLVRMRRGDGVHFTAEGREQLAEILAPYITAALADSPIKPVGSDVGGPDTEDSAESSDSGNRQPAE